MSRRESRNLRLSVIAKPRREARSLRLNVIAKPRRRAQNSRLRVILKPRPGLEACVPASLQNQDVELEARISTELDTRVSILPRRPNTGLKVCTPASLQR